MSVMPSSIGQKEEAEDGNAEEGTGEERHGGDVRRNPRLASRGLISAAPSTS